jgi:hypothetical protein
MKHSIQPLKQLWALLVLLAMISTAGTAFAQKDYTYTPSGPVIMKADSGEQRTQIVSITNETNSTTFLKIKFVGDQDFTFSHSQSEYLWIGADSTANFTVTYHATRGDTSIGYLRMYDSVNTADSIVFAGMDTGSTYSGPAWRIIDDSSYNAGDLFGRPDSAVVYVKNFRNTSVTVSSTLLLGSVGFTSVGSQQRTIVAGGVSKFYYRFDPKYSQASATVRISGVGLSDTIVIYGASSTAHTLEDTLTFDYVNQYFGPIAPADTAFRSASIYNWTDSAVTITELDFVDDQGTLSLVDAPSLPYTIPVHDSLVVLMRFIAPTTPHTNIYAYLYVESSIPTRQAMIIHGSSSGCVSTDPEFLWFGSVPLDSTATREVYVRNHTNDYLVIDSAYLRTNTAHGFTLNTHAPMTLAPNGDTTLSISFTATSGVKDTATLVFTTSGCDVRIMGIAASIDSLNVVDTSSYELFADSTQTLIFTGDSSFATQVFSFVNDLPDSLKIMSVSLAQGTHFQIFDIDPQYPQFKMGPDDIMDVTLQFIGAPGTYDDTLVIVTETGIVALTFPIHAVISASDVKQHSANAPAMHVIPNPATGPVHISLDNARTTIIEVLDVMGKVVAHIIEGTWDHSRVAAGTYFIRAIGVDADDKHFIITTRVILK